MLQKSSHFVVCVVVLFSFLLDKAYSQNFWQPTSGPHGAYGRGVLSLTTNSAGHVFAGSDTGVYRTSDNGGSWSLVGLPGIRFGSGTIRLDSSGRIYAGTYGSGVYRSTDNGASWTAANNGLTQMTIYALAINASEHIFVGTYGGVFRSTNNGGNWTTVNNGLTTTDVRGLAVNSSGHLFAGTWGGGMFRSTNNGGNWAAINNGMTMMYLSLIAVNPNGHIFVPAGIYVFRSTNNGDLWAATGGSPGSTPSSIVINRFGCLFVGLSSNGVSRCTDNGATWTSINSGLTSTNIGSLALNPDGYLYAGTSPGTAGIPGVFRSSQSTPVTETDALPTRPMLFQNYPNPFNPVTNFQFTIPHSQLTVLKVYDVLGREVATLVNEVKKPGVYAVHWDGSKVASGVYLYRLQAGSFVDVKKLILLK